MSIKNKISIYLSVFMFMLIHQPSYADALSEAYDAGYKAGYVAGLKSGGGGGGGSKGLELGFKVVPRTSGGGGGSTSGYEVPWAAQFNNKADYVKIFQMNKSNSLKGKKQDKSSVSKMLRAAKAQNGTVVIESVPEEQLLKLGEQFKKSNINNYWVAPSFAK